MTKLGNQRSMLHASVYYNTESNTFIVVHVNDFLCVGPWSELEPLYKNSCDIKSKMLGMGHRQ